MTDLVEKARYGVETGISKPDEDALVLEMADEIERLRSELKLCRDTAIDYMCRHTPGLREALSKSGIKPK